MRLPWTIARRQWSEGALQAAPVGTAPTARAWTNDASRGVGRLELRHLAEELAIESAAFLAGRYAETLAARGAMVPGWAWTNLLAHGSAESLRTEAQALDRGLLHGRAWLAARGYLAAEIIDRVERGVPLAALQRDVLVPFELDLVARAMYRPCHGLSVVEWVVSGRAALGAYIAVLARSDTARSE
jgi:hypothetical protein